MRISDWCSDVCASDLLDLLGRAWAAMERTLDAAWESRVPDLPLQTKEEELVLASIIEKETGAAEERQRIAGVFVRRIKLGIKLQRDQIGRASGRERVCRYLLLWVAADELKTKQ